MSAIPVEVRVRGRVTGELAALVAELSPTVVPAHTAITIAADRREPGRLVAGLDAAGAQVERIVSCTAPRGSGTSPGASSSPPPQWGDYG